MASIKQVAARAGVSVASVSRVLNHSKPVADETRDRVLAAVRDLNYSIDQRARGLRRQKSGTLGLVVSDVGNPFFSRVIRSIEAVTYESGHSLFLCNSDEDPERERFHMQVMEAQRIDGVIVLPVTNSGRALLPLLDHDIPVVCLDRGVDDVDLDTGLVDNVTGSALAVAHLIALGRRRIGIIGGRASTPGFERLAGYRQALAAAGIPQDPDLVRHGDFKEEGGCAEALALLNLPEPPTAIFAINHPMTLGALTAIRARPARTHGRQRGRVRRHAVGRAAGPAADHDRAADGRVGHGRGAAAAGTGRPPLRGAGAAHRAAAAPGRARLHRSGPAIVTVSATGPRLRSHGRPRALQCQGECVAAPRRGTTPDRSRR